MILSIEEIILTNDKRGIAGLKQHMPANYCESAAKLVLENPGTVIITTGFYILACKAPETDGPPGAIIIGNALTSLGYKVIYVTDRYCIPLMSALLGPEQDLVEFPITNAKDSKKWASEFKNKTNPSLLISIERCGLTNDGTYLNMRGAEITQFNAKIDYLFDGTTPSVGIGDGGNEIGMGNMLNIIPSIKSLPDNPCVTKVDQLIITSVSNWGGYGLVAALSILKNVNLLPSILEEQRIIKRAVDMGAVDGILNKPVYGADGFNLNEHSEVLNKLIAYLDGKDIN
tara:strand:- start:600 stop:1457 length:858 start_codon:yes stop_codon:yes gene_type:complete